MSRTFEEIGFLSPEVDAFRAGAREKYAIEFARLESAISEALTDLRSINGQADAAYFAGLAYWVRCIEACQAAALLTERGMGASSFSALRIAYECLFFACALWRDPALQTKAEALHHHERIKQARGLLRTGAATRVAEDRLSILNAVAAEVPPVEAPLSAYEAATAAGLAFEYEYVYRGCGMAGAHASARSLDDFCVDQPDGTLSLRLEPSEQRIGWLLNLIDGCLHCGIERRREAGSGAAA
jgi:hypothetical protein